MHCARTVAALVAALSVTSVAEAAPGAARTVRAPYRGASSDVALVSADLTVDGATFGAVNLVTDRRERTITVTATDDVTGAVAISIWQRAADGSVLDLGTFCGKTPSLKLRRPGTPVTVRPIATASCTAAPPVSGVVVATFRR